MRSQARPSREVIVPVALALSCLVTITLSYRHENSAGHAAGLMLTPLSPLERATSSVSRHTTDWIHGLISLGRFPRESRELRQEIANLGAEVERSRQLEREVAELRELLGFTERFQSRRSLSRALGAEVIGRDSSSWYRTVLIDKGHAHGTRVDSPVLTHEGLVGRVTRTSRSSSQVMLILDEQSGVGALVERSRAVGVVRGMGKGLCEMAYLSPRADIKVDDSIVSSGLGGVYPKGLRIGKITSVTRDGYMQKATVEPWVDFSRLEKVLVLEQKRRNEEIGE